MRSFILYAAIAATLFNVSCADPSKFKRAGLRVRSEYLIERGGFANDLVEDVTSTPDYLNIKRAAIRKRHASNKKRQIDVSTEESGIIGSEDGFINGLLKRAHLNKRINVGKRHANNKRTTDSLDSALATAESGTGTVDSATGGVSGGLSGISGPAGLLKTATSVANPASLINTAGSAANIADTESLLR